MSLKIKIKQTVPPEAKPVKRRIQRIESDDEDAVDPPSYDPDVQEPRSKKARTYNGGASDDSIDDRFGPPARVEDEDVDIDGDIEDTRFLPDPQPTVSRSLSPAVGSVKLKLPGGAALSSKSRPKEKDAKPAKSSKSSGKKPKRQVVYTDSEEEFDDPDVVVTDDEDFDPEPEYGSSKKGAKGKGLKLVIGKGKGKSVKKDEKEITFRDERKLPPQLSSVDSSGRSKVEDDKRTKSDEDTRFRGESQGTKSTFVDPLDEPIPKKRKLPPIKKNKPSGVGSTGPSTPAAKPPVAAPTEKKESLVPAPTSNQVGTRRPAGASTDVNLLDSSVYSELFKSAPGGSTPNSGLNRKQKEEERKKELEKMRAEARAKREAEARHSFDLQASPEKIQRFEESLRARRSMAAYPNVLGAAFKDMFDRHRAPQAPVAGSGIRY